MNNSNKNWKTIPDHPTYQIAPTGDVRRQTDGRVLKPQKANKGHRMVVVIRDGKRFNLRVVRLIGALFCKAFKPNLYPKYIDGDVWNVAPDNLQWVSRSEVASHPYAARPQDKPALKIVTAARTPKGKPDRNPKQDKRDKGKGKPGKKPDKQQGKPGKPDKNGNGKKQNGKPAPARPSAVPERTGEPLPAQPAPAKPPLRHALPPKAVRPTIKRTEVASRVTGTRYASQRKTFTI